MMTTPAFLHYTLWILCALLTAAISPVSFAQNEGRWYQVELLIFKRSGQVYSDELWRKDLYLSYPKQSRYIDNPLSKEQHELGGHNYTLRRSEGYKVLFHQAWNQQMWTEAEAPALVIRGGNELGSHTELEGTLKIHIGRYLHVTTDLWFSEYDYLATAYDNSGSQKQNTQNNSVYEETNNHFFADWPNLPPLPRYISLEDNSANTIATDADDLAISTEFDPAFKRAQVPSKIVTVREKRRMRSKETHYIDHPLIGIIVRMLPIAAPYPEQYHRILPAPPQG